MIESITRRARSLQENGRDVAWWKTRVEHRLLGGLYYSLRGNDGVDVMAQDWDTLILLDACRTDTLRGLKPDGWPPVQSKVSRGGNTWDFYANNFRDRSDEDTVVVTANPRTTQVRGDAFHDVVKVYELDWDDDLGTVWPDVMAERTLEAHEEYPEKRILSHWIQPHQPFIGSPEFEHHSSFTGESIWMKLRRGELDIEPVVAAYEETLELTLPEVQKVLDGITGLCVVSSDHGNLFGERPWFYPFAMFGHPRGMRMRELVEVPWVEFDSEGRRTIRSEKGRPIIGPGDQELIARRLSDLGYTS